MDNIAPNGSAIVLGGGLAGMLSAAALSKHFSKVLIFERDKLLSSPGYRKGVPQAHHVHGLLNGGRAAIDNLLPGLLEDLQEAGSVRSDLGHSNFFHFGLWKKHFDSGVFQYFQSRSLLDWCIQKRIAQEPNIELHDETPVKDVLHESGRVLGVRLEDGKHILSQCVVDATGRGSRCTKWLKEWGYGETPSEDIQLGLTYVSGIFEAPKGLHAGATLVYGTPPEQKRWGLALQIEQNQLIVTLQGYHGEKPPLTLEGFKAYAKSLAQPTLYQLLKESKLLKPLHSYTFPKMRRLRFEQMKAFPQGLFPIGDAQASLDPVFGQGMTVAAQEASLLQTLLQRNSLDSRQFLKKSAKLIQAPWLMASVEALRWPDQQGGSSRLMPLLQGYLKHLYRLCAQDQKVCMAFYRVMHLEKHPYSLFSPGLMARVLKGSLWSQRDPSQTEHPSILIE